MRWPAPPLQALVDLRAGAVDQYQAHTEAVEQGDIVDDVGKVFVLRSRAPQHQHKGLAPVCIDVGCGISEPAYVARPGVVTLSSKLLINRSYQGYRNRGGLPNGNIAHCAVTTGSSGVCMCCSRAIQG